MPVVTSPIAFAAALDPADVADYKCDFSGVINQPGESMTSQSVVLSSAAVAAGLLSNAPSAPAISSDGKGVVIWFSVSSGQQSATIFDSAGTDFLFEVTVNTSQARRFQRTFSLKVKQQ
jgi:hypothetical protein